MHDALLLVAASVVLAALVHQWRRVGEQIAAFPLTQEHRYVEHERRRDDRVLPLTPRVMGAEAETGKEQAMAA